MDSKKILIVGAGSGIGKALFEKANTIAGWETIGISRRGLPISGDLVSGTNYFCDLRSAESIFTFCAILRKTWVKLDAIYFLSGDGLFLPIQDLDPSDWEKHLSLNLTAPILLTSKLVSLLDKGSLLCYFSSTAGKQGFPDSSPYCATKHGLAGFAKAIREELKPKGVRVSTIYAGAIDTPIWDGREGFRREDMIPASDAAEFLKSLFEQPASFNQDEILFLPPKGVL